MAYSHDAIRSAIVRARELYENRWSQIALCEGHLGLSDNALQKRSHRIPLGWAPGPEVDEIELFIETQPEKVEQILRSRGLPIPACLSSDDTYELPEVLDVKDVDAIHFEDGDAVARDYSLIDGIFIFSIDNQIVSVPYDVWNRICLEYSDNGLGMTQAEIARKHGVPLPHLKRMIQRYGLFKTSAPACREEITAHQDNLKPIIDGTVEELEEKFIDLIRERRDAEWQSDYKKLRAERFSQDRMVENAKEMLAGVELRPLSGSRLARRPDAETYHIHVPTTDEHLGKYVYAKEAHGENYDTDEACQRLMNHADRVVEWIVQQPGNCGTIYRTFIGDLFHALTGETEHGTKLDQDTRGSRVWTLAFEAVTYSIDTLLDTCERVVIRGAKGNHDGFHFYQFMHLLSVHYASNPLVDIEASPGYYEYFRVADTLHIVDHGYRMNNLTGWKAKAQADSNARTVAGDDFHGAEFIYTYVGHLHELQVSTQGAHHTLIRLESLGESDDYETSLRYHTHPAAHIFKLAPDGRIRSDEVLFAEELRSA